MMKNMKLLISLLVCAGIAFTTVPRPAAALEGGTNYLPVADRLKENSWLMAGANPARTSWIPEQVNGRLNPLWYKPFEAYIPHNVQVITANGMLYISTSAGLYALEANTGKTRWVYPTSMPLGDSPAIDLGVVYVGGLDRRLHAVDALTGDLLWQFEAGAGFSTSPIVINHVVYIGNRDGNFYAISTDGLRAGQLAWKFSTGSPIDYGAAYKDGVVYFASTNSYAYALNATDGKLVWKSSKLYGAGFHAYWPVIYHDWVIFAGSTNYRPIIEPGIHLLYSQRELDDVYPHNDRDPRGTPVGPVGQAAGDWAAQTCTIDTSRPTVTANGQTSAVTEYFEKKPWRRTYFVLSRATGAEYTSDFDGDKNPEYAPILWQGTHSGNRFPPVVGGDDVIYQPNNYMSSPYIAGGQATGWKIGSPYISIISSGWNAVDEPTSLSAGGKRIYWALTAGRAAGSIDISKPNPFFPPDLGSGSRRCSNAPFVVDREITYFQYNLPDKIPGYDSRYFLNAEAWSVFGSKNGVYAQHTNPSPPIPYRGKLFLISGNSVIAFSPKTGSPVRLAMETIRSVNDPGVPRPSVAQLKARLAVEVQKMVDAGHLRPGYFNSGQLTYDGSFNCGYNNQYSVGDYWRNPADTLYTLARAIPYLPNEPGGLQDLTKAYLKDEFARFPPYKVTHMGWNTGAAREEFILPPEAENKRDAYLPLFGDTGFAGWTYDPVGFYGMWKYAQLFPAEAKSIFDKSRNLLETPPSDTYLVANPQVNNAYIAGYTGYLNLRMLAYNSDEPAKRQILNHLLSLRATTFTKDLPDTKPGARINYCRGLNMVKNFLDLVPETGQYLHDNPSALSNVQAAMNEYEQNAPEWFVAGMDAVYGEGSTSPLYNYHAILQAKALILKESQSELAKYIDVPGVAVGDLYYIDNLVSVIKASP